jgi:hypothetical protein
MSLISSRLILSKQNPLCHLFSVEIKNKNNIAKKTALSPSCIAAGDSQPYLCHLVSIDI